MGEKGRKKKKKERKKKNFWSRQELG